MDRPWDVLVIGAGPAGSSAAACLATWGYRTLMIDTHKLSHHKACGGALGALALDCLDEMGLASSLPSYPIRFASIGRRHDPQHRPAAEPIGRTLAVADRTLLDERLVRYAVACGATYADSVTALKVERRSGPCVLEVDRHGGRELLRAAVVVVAAGAAALGRRSETGPGSLTGRGFAWSAALVDVGNVPETIQVYAPTLFDERSWSPSWGWLSPTGPTSARVCLGVFGRKWRDTDVRAMFDDFVERLLAEDGRFRTASISGDVLGGALRCDFRPEDCVDQDLLYVGDAAGLSSPFTGEGIGFALESGRLAAKAIRDGGGPGGADVGRLYAASLRSRYVGYFEAGRHGLRRYQLTCRVLDATLADDSPLFRMARQTTLLPELAGRRSPTLPSSERMAGVLGELLPTVASVVANTNNLLLDTVRAEWPFIARWLLARSSDEATLPRPALLMSVAALAGDRRDDKLPLMAASIELGVLAALAGLSIEDQRGIAPDQIDWANMVATLSVDFLSTTAINLAAMVSLDFSVLLLRWMSELSSARSEQLAGARGDGERGDRQGPPRPGDGPPSPRPMFAELLYRSIVELPCEVGALAGDATPACVDTLRRWSRAVAASARAYDDVLGLLGRPSRLGATLIFSVRKGLSSLPPGLLPGERRQLVATRAATGRAAVREATSLAHREFPSALAAALAGLATSVWEPGPEDVATKLSPPSWPPADQSGSLPLPEEDLHCRSIHERTIP